MRIFFTVDSRAAIRGGYSQSGQVSVEVDPGTLSQEDRDVLAAAVSYKDYDRPNYVGGIVADAPTIGGLLVAIRADAEKTKARAEAAAKAEAEKRAEQVARVESLRDKPPADLIYWNGSRWALNREADHYYGEPADLQAIREEIVAPAVAERERRNAEHAEKIEAEQAAKDAEKSAAIADLKQWAQQHGSEVTRLRIEEGISCWVTSAREDFANSIAEELVAAGFNEAEMPAGYDASSERRKCPTAPEIKAIRKAREVIGGRAGISVDLMRVDYTDKVEGDDELETITQTELELSVVLNGLGTETRYFKVED